MSAPKLSVITTVRNGEAFMAATRDAILAQTFTGFEWVVVDNGCTDATLDILAAANDARVRIVRQTKADATFGDGIRLAYQHARGQYIAVQDADDVPMADRFERQVAALDADRELGLVTGAYQDMDAQGNLGAVNRPPQTAQALIDAFQTSNPLAHSTYMFVREAADQVGGYPPEYDYGPDFGLVIRMMKLGWKVCVLDAVLLKLRLHAGQASNAAELGTTRAHNALYLYQEAQSLPGVSPSAQKAGRRNVAKYRILYGLALMGEGRGGEGMNNILAAFSVQPLYAAAYLGYRFGRRLGLVRTGGH